MISWDEETTNQLIMMTSELRTLLKETCTSQDGNWFDLYELWSKDNSYEFIVYLADGFNEKPPNEVLYNDPDDSTCGMFFDAISMSIYICKAFIAYSRQTLSSIVDSIHPNKKLENIRKYFSFVDNNEKYKTAITLLNNAARESGVLQGMHPVDIAPAAYTYKESLEKYSIESIYLLFSYWRITSDMKYLSQLITSVAKYIRTYYKSLSNDEDMHLDWPIENETIIQQIVILSHWFELICCHISNCLDEYKKRNWFISVDKLVDDLSFPPFISFFEMLKYKDLYPNADNITIKKKGMYFHSYGVWIKTVDVLSIVSETASIIYDKIDNDKNPYGARKAELLEVSDNLKKLRDFLSGRLFTHKEFYDAMRKKYSFLVLDTYEHNAREIDSSVDELLHFTEGILSNDIEILLQSKQQFLSRISGFLTKEKERILDEYTSRVIEKIKNEIKKLNVYSELYSKVTQDFKQYEQDLLAYPDIFSSLASAEYLYNQYVVQQQPNEKFDYSCISILYYMALEDFANKMLYSSYVTSVLDNNVSAVKRNYSVYISHPIVFWDSKNHQYKRTCEIGNLGHLFEAVNKETIYANYLQRSYPRIDLKQLVSYGTELITIAPRRNEAAHGGNRITYNDVLIDKKHVYDSVETCRGLIMELFHIIFP